MTGRHSTRREFLKLLGAGAVVGPLHGCFGTARIQARGGPAGRPNIVLIMADDMGYSDIGCYGGEIHTPNIDRLAAGGLRFSQFYNAARCCPTRASLLTGLYPHQAGVGDMVGNRGYPAYQGYLNERCVTIAEALRPAGYHTLMAGKWHVGENRPHWPTDRGFDNRKNGLPPGGVDSYMSYGQSWANASNTPFRRYKHWVHEGGIATPFIAYWPAAIDSRGAITREVGHIIDVMATCVDVAGVRYPGPDVTPLEGKSLLPIFLDGSRPGHDALFWEHEGNRAVRRGKWKLVAAQGEPWELYDLEADRTELHDLAGAHPDKVEELKALYQSWADHCGVQPWPIKRPKG